MSKYNSNTMVKKCPFCKEVVWKEDVVIYGYLGDWRRNRAQARCNEAFIAHYSDEHPEMIDKAEIKEMRDDDFHTAIKIAARMFGHAVCLPLYLLLYAICVPFWFYIEVIIPRLPFIGSVYD